MGIISSIGMTIPEFLEALIEGKSGFKKVKRINTSEYRTDVAGEVDKWIYKEHIYDRCLTFLEDAVEQAVADASLDNSTLSSGNRVGVAVATSVGSADALETFINAQLQGKEVSAEMLELVPHNIPCGFVAEKYNIQGPCVSLDTACASGTNIIGYAYDLVKNGVCDIVIAGAVDIISKLSFSGFSSMMNITKDICRPFDQNRSGLLLGEGCGIAIIESMEYAKARGAEIYGEILGYGLSNDAFHETKPDPKGRGAVLAMEMALDQAKVKPENINYINAHGTGTKTNDLMELEAISKVFGEHTKKLKISSIKGTVGHNLGAAGAVEFVTTMLAVWKDVAFPTLNLINKMEPYGDWDFVPEKPKPSVMEYAISNSFGFAGNCSSIVVGKYV